MSGLTTVICSSKLLCCNACSTWCSISNTRFLRWCNVMCPARRLFASSSALTGINALYIIRLCFLYESGGLKTQSRRLQGLAGKGSFAFFIAHNSIRRFRGYTQILDLAHKMIILFVNDHYIQEIAVATSDAYRRHLHTKPAHEFIRRTFDRRPSNNWAYGDNHATGFVKCVMYTRYS